MSIKMANRTICGKVIIASLAVFAAGAMAAAQTRTTVNRLPNTIYLPNAAMITSTPATPLEPEKNVIKSLSALQSPGIDLGRTPNQAALSAKVQNFVTQNAKELGLDGNAAELVVKDTRETLTGHYVNMEQRLDGIPIIDGQVQVTVSNEGAVQSLVRNVVDVPTAAVGSVKKTATIDQKTAEDLVWKDLKSRVTI
jgi:Zn-dependent metalloprotease